MDMEPMVSMVCKRIEQLRVTPHLRGTRGLTTRALLKTTPWVSMVAWLKTNSLRGGSYGDSI